MQPFVWLTKGFEKQNAFSKVGYIQKSYVKYIRAIAPLCGESVIF